MQGDTKKLPKLNLDCSSKRGLDRSARVRKAYGYAVYFGLTKASVISIIDIFFYST